MNLKHSMLALALALGSTVAQAEINTIDNVPAATLLVPYFDIDLANSNGVSTTLTIGNSATTERLAHVTLWTDMGVPSMNFDVRLDGLDTIDIDLRDLFTSGTIPTSTAGGFGSCGALLPSPALASGLLTGLRDAHTGAASSLFGGQCGGSAQADGRARGFITIDAVSGCSTQVPGDPGYFVAGGNGTATNENVLWGEMVVSNPSAGVTYGDALVHVEADAASEFTDGTPRSFDHDVNPMTPNLEAPDYTFYLRIGATDGDDNREGLGQAYQARYELRGANAMETHALVWRDPRDAAPFACGSPPILPIGYGQVVSFDQQEEPATSPATTLPLATQSINYADSGAAVPFDQGMMNYSLDRDASSSFESRNQGYVAHVLTAPGVVSSVTRGWPVITADSIYGQSFPNTFPYCNDGIDNDSDGDVDFPDDADCSSATDNTEEEPVFACSDGIDNDADTDVDYPDDDGCESPTDIEEDDAFDNQCSDGIDNDNDGQTDWPADTLCSGLFDRTEANECGDGVDNDMDGQTDFPDDPNCISMDDFSELATQCQDGIDNDANGQIDFPNDSGCTSTEDGQELTPACGDGVDNDSDGQIDLNDPGCFSPSDMDESNPACSDGIDNDSDTLIDFPNDPGCASPQSELENPQCSDGLNNDGDMFTDFPADADCASQAAGSEFGLSPRCSDGLDNDGDGDVDYPADAQCRNLFDELEAEPECSDGVDNDADGRTDYPNSPTCSSPDDTDEAAECSDFNFEPNPEIPVDNDFDGLANFPDDPGCSSALDLNELAGSTTRECSDGIDNDDDGFSDYPQDPGCSSASDDLEFVPNQTIRAALEPYRPVPTLSHLGLALMAGLFAMMALYGLRRGRYTGE